MNWKSNYKKNKIWTIIGMSISGAMIITGSVLIGTNINKKATLVVNSVDSFDEPESTIVQGIGMLNYGYYYDWWFQDPITLNYRQATPNELKEKNNIIEDTKGSYPNYVFSWISYKKDVEEELKSPYMFPEWEEQCKRKLNFINEVHVTYGLLITGITILPLFFVAFVISLTFSVINLKKYYNQYNSRTIVIPNSTKKIVFKKIENRHDNMNEINEEE